MGITDRAGYKVASIYTRSMIYDKRAKNNGSGIDRKIHNFDSHSTY